MLRKTLTVLSLIGLLISVGLLGTSVFYSYHRVGTTYAFGFDRGFAEVEFYNANDPNLYLYEPGSYWREVTVNWQSLFGWPPSLYHLGSHASAYDANAETWGLSLPLWIPVLVLGLIASRGRVAQIRVHRRLRLGLCLKCGYDLRGSKGRCPECGSEFESSGVEGLGSSAGDADG